MRIVSGLMIFFAAAAGCAQSPPAAQPATAPREGPPATSAPAADGLPAAIDARLQALAQGELGPGECFAYAPAAKTVACVGPDVSRIGGGDYFVLFVGEEGRSVSVYGYAPGEGAVDVARIDASALATARQQLVDHEFALLPAEQGAVLAPGATIELAGGALRRERQGDGSFAFGDAGEDAVEEDRIELRCGDQWVDLGLADPYDNPYVAAEIVAYELDGDVLLVARADWSGGGDRGTSFAADFIDMRGQCEMLTR